MTDQKVLILVPNEHRKGGVNNYYKVLRKSLGANFEYFNRGQKKSNESNFLRPFRLIKDYYCYYTQCKKSNYSVAVINTSLDYGGLIRDAIFLLLTRNNIRKIVFFRGWRPAVEQRINRNAFIQYLFKKTFLNADHIIVLSSAFKKAIQGWDYNHPICVETTIVDEDLFRNGFADNFITQKKNKPGISLLYVGNIIKEKGVFDLLKAMVIIQQSSLSKDVELIIAGVGKAMDDAKAYVQEHRLNVRFTGFVRDLEKTEVFVQSDIFIFPSYYEGMPTSILEAMSFGLPVVTTRVGGLPDFFEDGVMGKFAEFRSPEHLAELTINLINDEDSRLKISQYNYDYSKDRFYSSKVASRLISITQEVANRN